ncbi:MAG TPA: hypothetical protein VKZ70_10335 [Burkholderiaceae bacterium]|nr:hypothetical protein [Burkholderiaceae bacterium]
MQYPDRLLGVMHFQFDNKVWKQTPNDADSEGAFGAFPISAFATAGATNKLMPRAASDASADAALC